MRFHTFLTTKLGGSPCLILDVPNVRMRNIRFSIEPHGWFSRIVIRMLRFKAECTWDEVPLEN